MTWSILFVSRLNGNIIDKFSAFQKNEVIQRPVVLDKSFRNTSLVCKNNKKILSLKQNQMLLIPGTEYPPNQYKDTNTHTSTFLTSVL